MAAFAGETAKTIPWWKEPSKDQWYAWWAAWLGWTLDAFDFTVFLLIMVPIEKDGTLGPRSDLVTLPGEPGPDRKQRRRRQGLSATPRYGFNTENAPVMMNWMRRQWPMACAITERGAAICGCAGLMHNAAVLFAPVSCRAIGPNLARVQ